MVAAGMGVRVCACRAGAGATLGLMLGLAGCSVGPNFKKPDVAVAESWRTNDARIAREAIDTQWWKSFGDPTLERLVELSQRQNLSLQVAGLRIIEARARLAVATGQQFPQVQSAFANAAAVGLSKNGPGGFVPTRRFFAYQVGFDAAWELDLWGKFRRGVESGTASLLASVGDYYSSLVSLSAEVARTYVMVRTYEVLLAQAQDNVRIQQEGLSIADSRFQNGATSELDVVQARTQLESTRATVPQLQSSLQQARNALCTLLGQQVGSLDPMLGAPAPIPRGPARVAVGVPAELLRRRPDVVSAELNAAAQCARIGIAKADLYPSFSLFGVIGLQASANGSPSANPFSGNGLFYLAGPSLSWQFYSYGRVQNSVRAEDARFQQLLVNYRDTVLRAAQEVEDATVAFLRAQEALLAEQASVQSAVRSVQIAVSAYREGATDFQRVLDAQRSLLQQQQSQAQTASSVTTNLIAVYKALGGGWELSQGQPTVPQSTQDEMKARTNWGDLLSPPPGPPAKNPPPGQH